RMCDSYRRTVRKPERIDKVVASVVVKLAATTTFSTLSLHAALPIWSRHSLLAGTATESSRQINTSPPSIVLDSAHDERGAHGPRSEEHTSELQSLAYLVCRLLLEKKKNKIPPHAATHR